MKPEGWGVSASAAALLLVMAGMQAVGLWASVAVGRVPRQEAGDRPLELVAVSEQYLRSWVRTVYWVRAGTVAVTSGVLWSYEMEREQVAEGVWPIGVVVAVACGCLVLVGVLLRVVADIVDRDRMRHYLGDDVSETSGGLWLGRWYANTADPRVIVSDIFAPGWVVNAGSPIAWALCAFGLGCVVTVVVGWAMWASL